MAPAMHQRLLATSHLPNRSGASHARALARLTLVATTILFSSWFLLREARALDPNRTLTQAGHRIWQAQQGLTQATITCVRQRQDGYVWLGTRNGVVRFDGMRFTTIHARDDQGFERAWIHDMQEDGEHNLWIATDEAGIIRLDGERATGFGTHDGLPSDNVQAVLVDRQGRIWAGTDRGLARFDEGRFVPIAEQQGLSAFAVRAICQGAGNEIWVGGDHGQLAAWNGQRFEPRTLVSISSGDVVNALLRATDGAIWIGTSNGLVRLDGQQERRYTSADDLAGDAVLCLAEGRHHTIYVGTKEGFSRLHDGDIENFGIAQGLSQSMVYTICEDHEGTLWVGTKHGLNQFIDRRTLPFTVHEGLPSNHMGAILQDRAGTIWAGTLDAGLARLEGRRFVPLGELPGLSNKIVALAEGPAGELWIGTDKGLGRLHEGKVIQTFRAEQGLPADNVCCLWHDQQESLWVGTSAGLAVLRGERFKTIHLPDNSTGGAVLAVADCGGQLLVSIAGRGAFRCVNDKLEAVLAVTDADDDVNAFCRDADGLLWLGTRGHGLCLVDDDRHDHFTSKDGLYDDEIFGIVADDHDRLWLACSKGCFLVSRSNLLKFAAGASPQAKTTWFSPLDAQHALECQEGVQPVVLSARDGRIWFATIGGLFAIDPSQLRRQLPPTTVVIEDIIVNGRSERGPRIPTIGPGEANITFHYTALSYASPPLITFRYRLDGFDKDWIDAGSRREAFYTNLPPGDYQFRVAAYNTDEKEYENATPVVFTVRPYVYQTVWFWPLCLSIVAAGAWSVYRLRVRRIREKLNTIVSERGRIARELHDTLMQGFSGVTMEMQALASRLPPSAHRATLNDIIQDAGNCLTEARRSVAGLRGDHSSFAASLAQSAQQITVTSEIRLEMKLDELPRRLPPDVEYNLLRIAQEAISNAVKHSGANTVEVVLNSTVRDLRLSIRDDGVGFQTGADALRHFGLIGMRERAAHIGAEFQLQSEPARGTSILVVLPASPAGVAERITIGTPARPVE